MDSGGYGWVTRYSKRGISHQVLKARMPRIPDKFLDCVVYLYPSEAAAEDGEHLGGSGFVIGIPLDDDHKDCITAIVTNKHVIERGNMVARLNTVDNKTDVIALDGDPWFHHPDGDDVAVCLIGLHEGVHKFHFIPPGNFCTRDRVNFLNVGPGDDCFLVGRFISRDGKQRNSPTVRFGNIAQMPGEPIIQSDGFQQESYLVEARSIPGYSGSPVFIQIPQAPPQMQFPSEVSEAIRKDMVEQIYGQTGHIRATLPIPVGPWLLGIDYCHLHGADKIISKVTGEPVSNDWFVRANSGMMGVVPVWKLEEILEGCMKPAIDAAKAAIKARRAKKADPVSLDDSSGEFVPAASDANPTHREDFTSLLNAAAQKPKPTDQT
jgi:hypothetical protein